MKQEIDINLLDEEQLYYAFMSGKIDNVTYHQRLDDLAENNPNRTKVAIISSLVLFSIIGSAFLFFLYNIR